MSLCELFRSHKAKIKPVYKLKEGLAAAGRSFLLRAHKFVWNKFGRWKRPKGEWQDATNQ